MFIGKRNSGIYFIEFFDPKQGKTRRISTGTQSKKIALRYQKKLQEQILFEDDKQLIKLSSFRKEYVSFIRNSISPSYLKAIELSFRQFKLFLNRDINIQEISTRLAQEFVSTVTRRAEQAAKMYLRTLKAAFNRAIDWEYLNQNPFAKIKVGRQTRAHPIFIEKNDLIKIISNTKNQVLKDLFLVTFFTGMRLSEVVNLKWVNINFSEKIIHLSNTAEFRTKNKKDRIIPLNQKILALLTDKYKKVSDIDQNIPVFVGPKGVKFQNEWVSKSFKSALRATKLDEKITFHTLRHSFASNLIQKGVSLYVVKELLGHEDISTTQIYAHLQRENLVEAISLL